MPRTRCRRRTRRSATSLLAAAALAAAAAACGSGDVSSGDSVAGAPAATADTPVLRLIDDAAVELSGLGEATLASVADDEWGEVLVVATRAADDDPLTPSMLGSYEVDGGRVVFRPRFPFTPGVEYLARYRPPGGGEGPAGEGSAGNPTTLAFRVERAGGAGDTRVVAVFPRATVWPMNQLKMYLHFSAPMRTGRAFDHIRLYDETTGVEVDQPFVTVQEELWDAEQRVLTVLYDPARIKRGLVPHEQAGLPLQEGHSYRLEIDAGWRDRDGRPLAEPYATTFEVGPVDRTSPAPHRWSVSKPTAATTDPLVVRFEEPLDHGLLHTLIAVRRAPGGVADDSWRTAPASSPQDEVAGRVEVREAETVWRFVPEGPWRVGSYELVVPTILEDLAGNTLRGLFDAEVATPPTPFSGAEAAYFGFEIAGRD